MSTPWRKPSCSRTGGIDGRGGFLGILHPRETIIDHTKGQQPSRGNRNVTFATTIDLRGTTGDKELDAKMAQAGRQILAEAKRQSWGWQQEHQMRRG